MRQILPHTLWLGHAADAQDFKRMFDLDINALVQLAVEEAPLQPPRELIYCRFPLVDGPLALPSTWLLPSSTGTQFGGLSKASPFGFVQYRWEWS